MKKKYINPITEAIRIELQHMIADSEQMGISNETTNTLDARGVNADGDLWED